MKLSFLTIPAIWIVAAACGGERADDVEATAGGPTIPAAELDTAARGVIAFLRDSLPFETLELADTVAFYVAPEGGGARTLVERERLRASSSWVVTSGRQSHALAPPPTLTSLTTKVGRHFDCMEYPLSSRVPELAHLPHVGARLQPPAGGSCLQTWNVTFVFDSIARPPRLVAVVYDQWEW